MAQCFERATPGRPPLWPALVILFIVLARPTNAQVPVESTGGVRALGMGGAFTAVADDASATWWNPAGISSLLADAVVEGTADDLVHDGDMPIDGRAAWRARPFAIAVAFPMVGISFNHLKIKEIRPTATGEPGPGRQDPAVSIRAFDLSAVGVTVVQSLGDAVVVGSTVRLVRAGLGSDAASSGMTVDDGLDRAGSLDSSGRTVADADVGVLAFAGPVRLAIVGRNLGSHTFETGVIGDDPFRLQRTVRVGAAVGTGPVWARRDWTLAVDADLTTTRAADGDRRSLAVGGERWIGVGRRVGLRAGGRVQTIGEARAVASGGASVAVTTGVYVEAEATAGGDRAATGWGLAARVTF